MSKERIDSLCNELKDYVTAHGCDKVTIGLSGGKDSTVAAALCAKAFGPDHVLGVWMPSGPFVGEHGVEVDEDVRRVCEVVGIVNFMVVGIGGATGMIHHQVERQLPISKQARINIQPRMRMLTLYDISQSWGKSMVVNTSNMDELLAGYGTVWGDLCGDIGVLKYLHVSEVVAIGDELGLPYDLVHKTPDDGLSGIPDEVNLGFKYMDVENLFRWYAKEYKTWNRRTVLEDLVALMLVVGGANALRDRVEYEMPDYPVYQKILDRMEINVFKLKEINLVGCGGGYMDFPEN